MHVQRLLCPAEDALILAIGKPQGLLALAAGEQKAGSLWNDGSIQLQNGPGKASWSRCLTH